VAWGRYKTQPAWVLGFHGCDRQIGMDALTNRNPLKASNNHHDWLGNGIYFWEGSPRRALEWAQAEHRRKPAKVPVPFVVGAIIDLGMCLNLTDRQACEEITAAFEPCRKLYEAQGVPLPENKGPRDKLFRYRDRAVIEFMHNMRAQAELPDYHTVRSPFLEGALLYDGAGFHDQTHIQIAVRDPACIKGYFMPLDDIDSEAHAA